MNRRPMLVRAICSIFTPLFVWSMSPVSLLAIADDTARGQAEMRKALESLWPRPSLDTYPVEFSVDGIYYRIPRNFLTAMDNWDGGPQSFVTVTVNVPDLKPLSAETIACFTAKPLDRPRGCQPLSFTINGTHGPSVDDVFEIERKHFHSQIPQITPNGLEKFDSGPPNARTEFYRKVENGRTRLYSCHFSDDPNPRHAVCRPTVDTTTAGSVIKFFFTADQLNDIVQIDADIRRLVENFTPRLGDEK